MKFQPGDKVKVKGELGRAEGTVTGFDAASGKYTVVYHALEAKDTKGAGIANGSFSAEGFADGSQMTKRRKS